MATIVSVCLSYFLIDVNKELRVNSFRGKNLFWLWFEEMIHPGRDGVVSWDSAHGGRSLQCALLDQASEREVSLLSPFPSMVPSEPQSIRLLPTVRVHLAPQLIVYETPSQTQSSCV